MKIVASNPASTKTDEIELKNADGIIMGERENLAPGLSSDFTLNLQPGEYTLNCTFQNAQRDNGKLTVTGDRLRDEGRRRAARRGGRGLQGLRREGDRRRSSTRRSGSPPRCARATSHKAKELFGPTRFHYEAVEPIAESFGDLDPEIDARVNDVSDKAKWTGFHRIEQILWRDGTTKGTERYASELQADVDDLNAKIAGLKLQPAQVANGAVGLLDEVSASKITGEEDRYSHTDLSDFAAQRRRRARRVRRAQAGARRAGRPAARDPDRPAHVGRRAGASTTTSATRRSATPPTPR